MKTCTKCGETKSLTYFSKKASKLDGLSSNCKACVAAYRVDNIDAYKARDAAYRAANSGKLQAYSAIYRSNNPPDPTKERARQVKYRADNSEKEKERIAKYRATNIDKVKASNAKYRSENKERLKISTGKWRSNNPSAMRAHNHNRRAREKAASGKLSKELFDKLFKLQRGKCPVCKTALSNVKPRSPMDHKEALANGGANEDWNIQILCRPCNSMKSAKDPIEFMQSKGFLL